MKKILLSFAVLAVAGAAFFAVNATTAAADTSLLMNNVEAMAQTEGGSGGSGSGERKYSLYANQDFTKYCCGSGNVRFDCGGTPACP